MLTRELPSLVLADYYRHHGSCWNSQFFQQEQGMALW